MAVRHRQLGERPTGRIQQTRQLGFSVPSCHRHPELVRLTARQHDGHYVRIGQALDTPGDVGQDVVVIGSRTIRPISTDAVSQAWRREDSS